MRRWPAPFLFILIPIVSYSQNFTISFARTQSNTAFIGLQNVFFCTVEGVLCKNVTLFADSGEIEKISGCNYIFRKKTVGVTTITISIKKNNKVKKIGIWSVVVKELPKPIAIIGGKQNGDVSKKFLFAQGGIAAQLPYFLGIDVNYAIKEFMIIIMTDGKIKFARSFTGNYFTTEIKDAFQSLQAKDKIIFSSITIVMPDKSELSADPLEFNITD